MALTYDQRLKTFTAWPHRSPTASEMAAAGFIFIGKTNVHDGQADAVKCLDCKSLLEPWWEGYVPFTEHAKYKPDCPFVIAQQQSAAPKASNATSPQPSDSASRNTNHQCSDVLTQPDVLAKLQSQAKRDAEEISKLKAEVQSLVKQRDRAQMNLAVQKDGRQEDLDLWKSRIEDARADTANALASKKTLDAAYATLIHDLNIEVKALRSMATPFQTAKGTFEAVHTKEVHELKTEIKALTTRVTPLQAAIEGLAASITRLQVGKVTVDHESVSEINGNDHHAGVIGNASTKASIDGDSLFSAEVGPTPIDSPEPTIEREEVLRDTREDTFDSECESEMNGNDHHAGVIAQPPTKQFIDDDSLFSAEAGPNPSDILGTETGKKEVIRDACEDSFDSECEGEAEMDNAAVDRAEVHPQNQDDSSASNADADEGDAWGTSREEDDTNDGTSAGATGDSLSDNDLASDDSWFDLESVSPSSNGPDSVGSD